MIARIAAALTAPPFGAEAEAVQDRGMPWALAGLIGAMGGGCVADTAGLEALGALELTPAALEFGTLGPSCEAFERPLILFNSSDADLEVQRIEVRDGEVFSIARYPAPLPSSALRLAPGASAEVWVRFDATEEGRYEDELRVVGAVAGAAFMERAQLTARFARDRMRMDRFVQNQTADADILFVIDSSCSMVMEQDALTRNFRSFIEIADSGLLNYQIAVTTTDVSQTAPAELGRLVPVDADRDRRIVTRLSAPSAYEHFRVNGRVGVRDNTLEEQGLEAARLALSSELLESHNFGFVREHALLSVIFVSDEFDQSLEPDLDVYAEAFLALKEGDPSKVTVSAVVGEAPMGCDGPGGPATEAPRYTELARRLGGAIESICTSDWSDVMRRLSSTAFGLRVRFALAERPSDPSAVEVTVDGTGLMRADAAGRAQWTYDAATNSVVFASRSVPGPGASVQVLYQTECRIE